MTSYSRSGARPTWDSNAGWVEQVQWKMLRPTDKEAAQLLQGKDIMIDCIGVIGLGEFSMPSGATYRLPQDTYVLH